MTGLRPLLLAAILLIGGMLVERLMLVWRPGFYFRAGFPLLPELVPIPAAPEAEAGRTASVRWERKGDLVRFWVDPAERNAPMGLHGMVRLVPGRRGVRLLVRWSPPWAPLLAAAWFAGLGLARGEGLLTVPVGSLLVLGLLYGYRTFAVRVAAELRWSFVRGGEEP